MRLKNFMLAAALALFAFAPLAACTTTAGGVFVGQTADEKALITGNRLYNVATTAYLAAYKVGWRGPEQERAKHALTDTLIALAKAGEFHRQAQLADTPEKKAALLAAMTAQLAIARTSTSEATALLPPPGPS